MTPKFTTSRKAGQPTIKEHAVRILEQSGRPMTAKEITDKILRQRALFSKDPVKAVYSVLYREERFKRVGPALFKLVD